jgi:hypothetical protein
MDSRHRPPMRSGAPACCTQWYQPCAPGAERTGPASNVSLSRPGHHRTRPHNTGGSGHAVRRVVAIDEYRRCSKTLRMTLNQKGLPSVESLDKSATKRRGYLWRHSAPRTDTGACRRRGTIVALRTPGRYPSLVGRAPGGPAQISSDPGRLLPSAPKVDPRKVENHKADGPTRTESRAATPFETPFN